MISHQSVMSPSHSVSVSLLFHKSSLSLRFNTSIKCEPNQCQTQIFQQAYIIPLLIPTQSECGVLLSWRLFVFTHLLLMCLFTSIDDSGSLGGLVCLFCNRATFQHCWSEESEFWMSHLFWLKSKMVTSEAVRHVIVLSCKLLLKKSSQAL